jgi:hypothetical protein
MNKREAKQKNKTLYFFIKKKSETENKNKQVK